MACKLVTNFEVALIKKLWQCSVLSCTLPSPPTLGEGEGTATLKLPRDPCDISIGLSRIPLNKIGVLAAIRDQWRCVIAAQIEEKPETK